MALWSQPDLFSEKDMKKKFKILIISLLAIAVLGIATVAGINLYIIEYAKPYVITAEEAETKDFDCVIALGAQVLPDGTPCHQLYDRVMVASSILNQGKTETLLLSGDSRVPAEYDEIGAMKKVANDLGVEDKNILSDPAGLNTYKSMENLKSSFKMKSCIVVTQEYHIYRSVYIARKLGLDAYGVSSDPRGYATIVMNEAREVLARVKAFYMIEIDK